MAVVAFSVLVTVSILTTVGASALELKEGVDVTGQWKRGNDLGRCARLKVLAVGNTIKIAYAAPSFGETFGEITEDSFLEFDAAITESPGGVKVIRFTGRQSLADFVFIFDPGLPYIRGSWTSLRNKTYTIEMK